MAREAPLVELFESLFELRRREPRDDIVSRLVAAAADDQIKPAEMMPICLLLLVAGFETTVNLIGNGTLALLRNPDQLARLRSEPDLVERAVEELLRYDSPIQLTVRYALRDAEIALRPGDLRSPIEQAVRKVIGAGYRTGDIYSEGMRRVNTREMGDAILGGI